MANVNQLIANVEALQAVSPSGFTPAELADYVDEEAPEVRGPWMIQTATSADWALRRLAECEAEEAEIDRQAAAAIEAVKHRAETLKAKAKKGQEYFRFRLMEWAQSHPEEIRQGKKKSREFIHGKIAFRATGGRLTVKDKEALLLWLAEQPIESGLYRMKLEPDMRALQEFFKGSSQIPPGMEFEPERDEINVTAALPGAALAKKE